MENSFAFDLNILIRLVSAVLLGAAIGLERELTNKYAGLRTHILVCLGACVFTVLSIYGFPTFAGGDNFNTDATGVRDTARIAAQIVTGIGFIGAGTVLRHGSTVFGLTTAATLWVAAGIGMACGAAQFPLAIFATVLSVAVLILVKYFERDVLSSGTKNLTRLKISFDCNLTEADDIYNFILEQYSTIHDISKKNDGKAAKIVAVIDVNAKNPVKIMTKTFKQFKTINNILIQETDE